MPCFTSTLRPGPAAAPSLALPFRLLRRPAPRADAPKKSSDCSIKAVSQSLCPRALFALEKVVTNVMIFPESFRGRQAASACHDVCNDNGVAHRVRSRAAARSEFQRRSHQRDVARTQRDRYVPSSETSESGETGERCSCDLRAARFSRHSSRRRHRTPRRRAPCFSACGWIGVRSDELERLFEEWSRISDSRCAGGGCGAGVPVSCGAACVCGADLYAVCSAT